MRLHRICLLLVIVGGLSAEPLVNRRVLLVNFVNQNKSTQAEYLSVTVPESFIGPLQKTASFEILSRDLAVSAAKKLNISDADLFSDANAVALGKSTGAEVVVIGNYVVIQNSVQIQTKAIDVASGRVKASQQIVGKTDGSIFDTVARLALAMSADMKQNLPPLPQREVVREKTVYVEGKNEKKSDGLSEKIRASWYFGAGVGANLLIDVDKNIAFGTTRTLNPGPLFSATWGKTILPQLLLGASHFVSTTNVEIWEFSHAKYQTIHFDNFLTATYFPFVTGFNVRAGFGGGLLKYVPDDAALVSGGTFGFAALGQMGYTFWLGQSFNLGINAAIIIGSSEKDAAQRFLLFATAEWF